MKRSMFVCVFAIVMTALLSAEVASAAGTWSVVPSPSPGSGSVLQGVAAVSASNLWAVGASQNTTNGANQTLTEHWNGTSWKAVSSPKPGASSILNGVAAVSATNLWAVGYSTTSSNIDQTLIEHWNGTSWQIVSSPSPGFSSVLQGVAAVSANDIWAVGDFVNNNINQTLIEHWNGTNWQVVSSPNVAGSDFNVLYGVVAVSANNIWAVGQHTNSNGNQTLIEHWNGTSWKIISSSNPGSSSSLQAVAAISASDIWAVGEDTISNAVEQTLTEHWNGTSWQVVSSPNSSPSSNQLFGVTAISASNLWAVGDSFNSSGFEQTLIEHWNGTSWQVVSSPNVGANNNILTSVAAISARNIWTVGFHAHKTLIEHWN